MKIFKYSISTSVIWTSFDHGTVEAESASSALSKAKAKLEYDFGKVNHVLNSADVTAGFSIEFDNSQIQIQEL